MNTVKMIKDSPVKKRIYSAIALLSVLSIIMGYISLINLESWGYPVSLSLIAITSILSMSLLSLVFNRHIGSIFQDINIVLDRLENGDLTRSVQTHAEDDLGRFCQRFNDVIAAHRQKILAVAELLQTSCAATDKVHSSSAQLAQNVQQQSVYAESIQSALEEMIFIVISTAEINQKAVNWSTQSSEAAKNGGEIVRQTVDKIKQISIIFNESMDNINKVGTSCEEIGQIVSLISKIASQTNLLALNAAIEAARAGKEGRGFAVVADEVRNLAAHTSEATKQIEDVVANIKNGVAETAKIMDRVETEVSDGLILAEQAGQALDSIVQETEQVLSMVGELASTNDESAETSIDKTALHIDRISTATCETQEKIRETVELVKEHREYLVHWFRLAEEFPKLVSKFKF